VSEVTEARQKLQSLLRELFQFDCADLDFGIYRIMNHKRAEIERFVEKDLLDAVSRELDQGVLSSQAQAASQLAEAEREVRSALGAEVIAPDGELADQYRTTPLGQRYLELREEAAAYHARPEQETLVFNHLYAFFSRYYQDGDFISKRRYSRRERYAIPYNGEEVYLHWANKDQYYVKTGEHFTDYTFKAPGGVTVHFKLQAADVEQNNVKGEKRFFIPLIAKAAWDETAREVVIPFEYRPLTEQENITYGTRDQQEKIIAEALQKLPARLKKHTEAVAALMPERRRNKDGEPVSYLEHHLRQYTRRNTSDFFIHKDLRGFLERELDFYLKNEVLNLDEVLAGDDERAEGWFHLMQVIRRIALCIIAFLAQIEDFQRRLWEKKKFVLSTEYCMTLDRVPEDLYPEIAANQAQIEEWRRLFRIDEIAPTLFHSGGKAKKAKGKGKKTRLDVAFLKAHPSLVLDTRFFDQDFKDRLLATFDDLEEQTGGLLIHGDNYQALNLLLEAYRERVKCIYLDPPFNTAGSEILYKNEYKHSSWLAMITEPLARALSVARDDCVLCVAIDDFEGPLLTKRVADIFGNEERHLATVVVRSNPHGRAMAEGFSRNHEYALFFGKTDQATVGRLPRDERRLARYPEHDEQGSFAWMNFRATGANSRRVDRPKLFYPICVSKAGEIRISTMSWLDTEGRWEPVDPPRRDESAVLPIDDGNTERVWNLGWERAQREARENLAARQVGGRYQIYRKYRPNQEGALPGTWWDDAKYSATESGTSVLKDLLGEREIFSYPKSVYLVEDCLRASNFARESCVLDFFAGSGTTAHAVLNLNAEDGGSRKYVLVEMADYFDTALKPRIEKVMFSREWKDGKPTSNDGHSHIFKYQRLESYEDALNNIAFDDAAGQKALDLYGGDYLLRYMLGFETHDSETLLSVERLEAPFSYTLRVHRDGETREQPVDLPETFNYLIGLHVKTRRVYHDGERRYLVYRGSNERSEVVVIWRDTKGWTQADLERDKQFVLEQKLTEGADEVYVNGDSFIPRAQALDPVFKRLMLGGAE